jgi:maltose O-acetyltransferase
MRKILKSLRRPLGASIEFLILIIFILVEKNENRINKIRTKRFIKNMGYCHDSVKFYFPVYIEPRGKVFIQEGVSIAPFVQIWAHADVRIGRNTMIASHTVISASTHDHAVDQMNTTRIDKPVTIGNNVWISSGAIIAPGVSIGDGAVIGAGSVVLNNVESNSIVVGNPARLLKYRNIHHED